MSRRSPATGLISPGSKLSRPRPGRTGTRLQPGKQGSCQNHDVVRPSPPVMLLAVAVHWRRTGVRSGSVRPAIRHLPGPLRERGRAASLPAYLCDPGRNAIQTEADYCRPLRCWDPRDLLASLHFTLPSLPLPSTHCARSHSSLALISTHWRPTRTHSTALPHSGTRWLHSAGGSRAGSGPEGRAGRAAGR